MYDAVIYRFQPRIFERRLIAVGGAEGTASGQDALVHGRLGNSQQTRNLLRRLAFDKKIKTRTLLCG